MLLEALRSGGREWNAWRAGHPGTRIDLRDADLENLCLEGEDEARAGSPRLRADLRGAILCGASLKGAKLGNADLSGSNLRGASLREADLAYALFHETDLTGADFSGANLLAARLTSALLVDVDFNGSCLFATFFDRAVIGGTRFSGVDLSRANGLETVRHVAPSEISVSTLLKSRGLIRQEFLAGAGVPVSLAAQISSLMERSPVPYCGIVSAAADRPFAERLRVRIGDADLCAWILSEPEEVTEPMEEAVQAVARTYDKLIIVLSHEGLSDWMRALIQVAKRREIEAAQGERQQLIFVGIGAREQTLTLMKGLGSGWLSQRTIHDFARWTHDDTEESFSGLLRDLLL